MSRRIDPTMSLAQIATNWPELVPELDARRLDYCCGGLRSLAEAATAMGLSPDALALELSAIPALAGSEPERDWRAATMSELADHIEQTHHAFVRQTLERLSTLIRKCVLAHGDDEPRLIELQRTISAFVEDMYDHMVREERVLFPWLRRLERPTEIQSGPPWSVRRPIDCMVHDHDDAGRAFETMRLLTDDFTPPENACPTWNETYRLLAELVADTHVHIHKENNILFPAGIEAEHARAMAGRS